MTIISAELKKKKRPFFSIVKFLTVLLFCLYSFSRLITKSSELFIKQPYEKHLTVLSMLHSISSTIPKEKDKTSFISDIAETLLSYPGSSFSNSKTKENEFLYEGYVYKFFTVESLKNIEPSTVNNNTGIEPKEKFYIFARPIESTSYQASFYISEKGIICSSYNSVSDPHYAGINNICPPNYQPHEAQKNN